MIEWVATQVVVYDLGHASVLEVGSANVNGSARQLFGGPYLGVDLNEGPGVDEVATAWALPYPPKTFDVVLSTEMLEHCEKPEESFVEMVRVLKPGGRLLITCRSPGFPLHNEPDHWRFTPANMRYLLLRSGLYEVGIESDKEAPGVLMHAMRPDFTDVAWPPQPAPR